MAQHTLVDTCQLASYPAKVAISSPDHPFAAAKNVGLVISRQDASRGDRRYSAGSSFQADGRRCCANDMLLHGASKKLWVDVSGASFGWSKLGGSSFSFDA